MKVLVTGVAGFIGSNLADTLLSSGATVVGVDCLTDYYPRELKRLNLRRAETSPKFRLVNQDLSEVEIGSLLDGVDVVAHQAGQPGVRSSYGGGFAFYLRNNVLVTQRLAEACLERGVRLVNASSSSVYGNQPSYPVSEDARPLPRSPYGVTKLAAEHIVTQYGRDLGLESVSLRYHTVYGPRQRPDMAIHRLIEAGIRRQPFPLQAPLHYRRDFTHVSDIVTAVISAIEGAPLYGDVLNVSAAATVDLATLVLTVEEVLGSSIHVHELPHSRGDVETTGASVELAREVLGWEAATPLREGIVSQVAWHLEPTVRALLDAV